MKERPILFNADMVRAILSGQKTQTRRLIKRQPHSVDNDNGVAIFYMSKDDEHGKTIGETPFIPLGQIGDHLWVRETYQGPLIDICADKPEDLYSPKFCVYAADGGCAPEFVTEDDDIVCRWRPSIHMPRWASRITLEITGVRVERLQDISDDDARAEGFNYSDHPSALVTGFAIGARTNFRHGWDACYGSGSWDANPWVWVIEFKRIGEAME